MTKAFASLGIQFCMFTAKSLKGNRVHSSDYEPVTAYDPSRDAAKDMAYAPEEARRKGRRLLLDVGGSWCIWRHRLDEFFEENPDAAVLLHKNCVAVKENLIPENKNKEVLSRYPKIAAFPHSCPGYLRRTPLLTRYGRPRKGRPSPPQEEDDVSAAVGGEIASTGHPRL